MRYIELVQDTAEAVLASLVVAQTAGLQQRLLHARHRFGRIRAVGSVQAGVEFEGGRSSKWGSSSDATDCAVYPCPAPIEVGERKR